MTVQNVPRIAELSPGDVSDPGDRRYTDGIADRSGRFPRTASQPSRDSNVRPRDGSGAVQSTLPEHQLRTRFRHVYAGRRYAASGRLVAQPGGNRVFSCVTSRYRTDLLRRLKEARSIDSFDQGGSPDARRPGEWLSGHGLLLRTDHTSHSSTVGSRRNIEQSAVKGVQRDIYSLALESGHRADPTSGVSRHSVEYAKAVNGQQDLPRHDAPMPAAGANTTPYTRTVSAAAETVCSCPTACRGHDVEHVDRPHTGRSHPARLRMKLSSRLSHEAQCAINETRREMGVSLVGSDSVSDDKPKETSACTDSVEPHSSSEHIPDVTLRAENATNQHYCFMSTLAQTKGPIYKTRLCKQPECYSTSPGRSHDTGNTHAGTHATRQHGGMPALTSLAVDGVTPSLNVFTSSPATYNNTDRGARLRLSLSQCYRTVPLLRKAREKTFEITPPWYDSRYTDDPTHLPLCTPVEPPKDIKSHAVEKCLGWLNKYL